MAKASLAERAAKKWIKRKKKEYARDAFIWLAGAIIDGSKITENLPPGTKEIIREKLAEEFGWDLPSDLFYSSEYKSSKEHLPVIKRPSLENAKR